MPRKFTHHTGIEARGISVDDELTMGLHAVRRLQRETGCNLADCRGIVFVSPSFIPPSVARRHLPPAQVAAERPSRAARQRVDLVDLVHHHGEVQREERSGLVLYDVAHYEGTRYPHCLDRRHAVGGLSDKP